MYSFKQCFLFFIDQSVRCNASSTTSRAFQTLSYSINSNIQSTPVYGEIIQIISDITPRIVSDTQHTYNNINALSCKLYAQITLTVERGEEGRKDHKIDKHYICTPSNLFTYEEIPDFGKFIVEYVLSNLENSLNKLEGSGWRVISVDEAQVNVCQISHNSLRAYQPYPINLRGRKHVYNPDTTENCVLVSVAAHLKLAKKPGTHLNNLTQPQKLKKDRFSNLTKALKSKKDRFWREELNVENIDPANIQWQDLSILEKNNSVNINIYHLATESNNATVTPNSYSLHLARRSRFHYNEVVSLLLIGGDHVCLIPDLKQYYRNFTKKHEPIHFLCPYCLATFDSQDMSNNHTEQCSSHTTVMYPPHHQKSSFHV